MCGYNRGGEEMSTWHFLIVLAGSGETPEEGWLDACEGFSMESGAMPDEYSMVEEDDEETREEAANAAGSAGFERETDE